MYVRVRVTSATPGRILKGRNRNVHESIPAAVRRRTRRWLPRRAFPGIKTGLRSPGQKPTTAALCIPVAAVERCIRPWCASEKLYLLDEEETHRRRTRDLENRRSESGFSDETRERSTVCRAARRGSIMKVTRDMFFSRRVALRDSIHGDYIGVVSSCTR